MKAQTQLSILEARIAEKQQDRETNPAEINSLLNRKPGTPLGVPEESEPTPLGLTVDEMLTKAHLHRPICAGLRR